ncbi:hypothetical protein [Lysinibacillus sp. Bpr_S20]|uniref:hypothetical protein n=1 Tax=Lysinibacillus sp. Bpr_S20 TaxID=2933964 RepID=UPI002010E661|nr:hypothetical protein [Lysinibacillus sp. Bpr_S20]MCL1700860.1 hypothetical protein [Lysinibacillus sp. Bpr_S20]
MVSKRNKRFRSSIISTSNHIDTDDFDSFNIQKRSWFKYVLLTLAVPFATLASSQIKVSAAWYDKLNPIPKETQAKVNSIIDTVYKIFDWFKNIKQNITELSTDVMFWVYETLTKVILHTPSILFNTDWFKSNILTFTGLSIATSILLSMFEGLKLMSSELIENRKPTDLKRISKRIPLVALGSAIAPSAFYYMFKGLNKLTDIIIDFGKFQMKKGMSQLSINDISLLQVFGFIGFDIALITMLIPILLQNFRRWFDLLALGVMTPLALASWVFASQEHWFIMWRDHIKKCATVQVVYAIFLLLIGTLLFGTKLPNNSWDVMIQLGIVIGGLWRMNTPPNFLSRYIDRGEDVTSMWNGAFNVVRPINMIKKKFKLNNRNAMRGAKSK